MTVSMPRPRRIPRTTSSRRRGSSRGHQATRRGLASGGTTMNVGDSVRKAIDDWMANELNASMLHACNAIDGTAKKQYPGLGSNARFTRVLRENYSILG